MRLIFLFIASHIPVLDGEFISHKPKDRDERGDKNNRSRDFHILPPNFSRSLHQVSKDGITLKSAMWVGAIKNWAPYLHCVTRLFHDSAAFLGMPMWLAGRPNPWNIVGVVAVVGFIAMWI
jgi:hypothetical protein